MMHICACINPLEMTFLCLSSAHTHTQPLPGDVDTGRPCPLTLTTSKQEAVCYIPSWHFYLNQHQPVTKLQMKKPQ